jgi:hypothetical protein
VFREFEEFVGPEVRTWWLDGECVLVTPHPDQPDTVVAELPPTEQLTAAVVQLACPFVTVDLARHLDGAWRVVEVGDGQVSDRPRTLPAGALIAPLFARR